MQNHQECYKVVSSGSDLILKRWHIDNLLKLVFLSNRSCNKPVFGRDLTRLNFWAEFFGGFFFGCKKVCAHRRACLFSLREERQIPRETFSQFTIAFFSLISCFYQDDWCFKDQSGQIQINKSAVETI